MSGHKSFTAHAVTSDGLENRNGIPFSNAKKGREIASEMFKHKGITIVRIRDCLGAVKFEVVPDAT